MLQAARFKILQVFGRCLCALRVSPLQDKTAPGRRLRGDPPMTWGSGLPNAWAKPSFSGSFTGAEGGMSFDLRRPRRTWRDSVFLLFNSGRFTGVRGDHGEVFPVSCSNPTATVKSWTAQKTRSRTRPEISELSRPFHGRRHSGFWIVARSFCGIGQQYRDKVKHGHCIKRRCLYDSGFTRISGGTAHGKILFLQCAHTPFPNECRITSVLFSSRIISGLVA